MRLTFDGYDAIEDIVTGYSEDDKAYMGMLKKLEPFEDTDVRKTDVLGNEDAYKYFMLYQHMAGDPESSGKKCIDRMMLGMCDFVG